MKGWSRRVAAGLAAALVGGAAWVVEGAERLGALKEVKPGGQFVELRFSAGRARISSRGEGLLHLRITATEFDEFPSFAVLPGEEQAPRLSETENTLVFDVGLLQLVVKKETGAMDVLDAEGRPLFQEPAEGGAFFAGATVGCEKMMPADEHYYGFGEKTGPLDKRGRRMVMWNTDAPHSTEADPLYQSHPFFLALRQGRAAGLFFDNTFRSEFDLGVSNRDRLRFQAAGGELNYWVIAGPTPKEVLRRYGELVGRMPLPPLWGIGYHQSRWSYENEQRVREIRDGFRAHRIPVDAVYLDIHHMDGYRVFTFDPERFPDPAGLFAELKQHGIRTVVIVDPGIKIDPGYPVYDGGLARGFFFLNDKGEPFVAYVWPGACHFPDFYRPEVREWWGTLFEFYTTLGADGFWLDMNEPAGSGKNFDLLGFKIPLKKIDWLEARHGSPPSLVPHARLHNVYARLEAEATYEGLLRLRPTERPFIITRAGYAGVQRYALMWTGDNFSTWGSFQTSLPMLLNLGLSGYTFVGADIGGFGGAPSRELYARWIEAGVFYPFCRTHTAVNMPDQEPWSFGEEVTAISREYILLRYRLLPYTYTYFEDSSRTNLPVMRALLLEFPHEGETAAIADQFLWGEWLLVAPVVEKGRSQRPVYFPEGEWFDWFTFEKISGPGWKTVEAPLNKLPLYARAGAIIPLAPEMQHTSERPWNPLTILVFPGRQESRFTLYQDDGLTLNYQKGEWSRTTFVCRPLGSGVEVEIEPRQGAYEPGPILVELKVFGQPPEAEVSIHGPEGGTLPGAKAAFDKSSGAWLIELEYDGSGRTIKIRRK